MSTHPASSLSRRLGLRLAPSCRPSHPSTSFPCPQHIGFNPRSLPSSRRLPSRCCMGPSTGRFVHAGSEIDARDRPRREPMPRWPGRAGTDGSCGFGTRIGRWDIMIGLRELLIIGMVVLVLYGRSGVLKSPHAKTILPWLSPVRRTSARRVPPGSRATTVSAGPASIPGAFLARGNRLYWFLTILAATAVAALIIARALITKGSSTPLLP